MLAARSTPRSSESANWLNSSPGTVPVALYAVRPGSDVSKRWIEVAPPAASQRRVATKRLDADA